MEDSRKLVTPAMARLAGRPVALRVQVVSGVLIRITRPGSVILDPKSICVQGSRDLVELLGLSIMRE